MFAEGGVDVELFWIFVILSDMLVLRVLSVVKGEHFSADLVEKL